MKKLWKKLLYENNRHLICSIVAMPLTLLFEYNLNRFILYFFIFFNLVSFLKLNDLEDKIDNLKKEE